MSIFRVLNNLFRFNRTNWKAVSLCFVAATVFWFFNALNKEYASNVRFPLRFEFDLKKYAPSRPLPQEIYINVGGKGWDLLRKNLGLKLPTVTIPLERPGDVRKIVAGTLPPILTSQLGNLQINHIVTDTLYLSIEPRDSVRLKVIVDMNQITYRDGYGRTSPVVVLPDSIELLGPRSLIRKLEDSQLVSLGEKKVIGNFREQLEIPQNELIKRNPPVVEVIFEVGEIITVDQKILLKLINIPEGSRVNLAKDSVSCRIQIPKTRGEDFVQAIKRANAILDLVDTRRGARKAAPALVDLPSYSTLLSTDSVLLRMY